MSSDPASGRVPYPWSFDGSPLKKRSVRRKYTVAFAQLNGVGAAPSFSRSRSPLESGVKVTVPWALTVAVAPEETSRTVVPAGNAVPTLRVSGWPGLQLLFP